MMASPALRLTDIAAGYATPGGGRLEVLRGASLVVCPGEITALTGRSGSGKSTLLAIAAMLQRADLGCVEIGGLPVTDLSQRSRTRLRSERVGVVFQSARLIPQLTALENVLLPLFPRSRRPHPRIAHQMLEGVGLGDRSGHLPSALSGGEAQRVALCRALVTRPSLLVADEPTASLDLESASVVRQVIRDAAERGIGVLVATHDPQTAAWADSSVSLVDGSITGSRMADHGEGR